MNFLRSILDVVTTQQDFLWFCTLLVWLAAGALVHLHREKLAAPARWWLTTVWVCGALLAGGELVLHALPADPFYEERAGWDLTLNGLQTAQALAAVLLLPVGPGRRPWLLLLGGALLLLWLGRVHHFVATGLALLAAGGLVAGAASRATSWRRLLWVLALAPVPATTGVWAELIGHSRRWVDLSLFALPSAVWQLLCAGVLIQLLGRMHGWLPRTARETRVPAELRGFLRATAVWLVVGLGLAVWTGRLARAAYEESLMNRVRAAAALITPADAAAIVAPGFVVENLTTTPQPGGGTSRVARSPHLLEAARPMRHQLARIQRLNPDVGWAQFMTLRGEYLVTPALAETMPPANKAVFAIDRAATAFDRRVWADRTTIFEGPFFTDYGEYVRVRTPVIAADNRMLGWLAFEVGAVRWAAAQALARLQTFALVGLGVALALFVTLQRLDRLERDRVEREALAALAADRAKTAFLAKVSHELRTPIQSILGYGELLANQVQAPEPSRWLGAVRSQGQMLIRLVNDLLDLSALQAGAFRLSPQPGHLGELVRSTVDSLGPRAAAKGLALTAEIAGDLPACLAFDPERLRQVLLNLIGNAIKFTGRGEIRVRLVAVGPATPERTEMEITVQDSGPGISAEDQLKLFRPFVRLHNDPATEGAGLGLALSAAICQSMGGTLRVESDGVRGTTFKVRLALTPATPAAPVAVAPPPVELQGMRVLVADDNPLVRELFVTSLRQAGAWVDAAADGLEAVELCVSTPYAVVVLDVSMPWLNGVEAARRIRAATAGPLRIVGVSAHATQTERELALAAGMDLLLVKPVAITPLLAAVAGRPFTDPAATARSGSPADLVLLRRLRRQFGEEAPHLQGELDQALKASDRRWLRAKAHYLKNSADVAGFPEVSLLCAEVERLTQEKSGDPAPVVAELLRLLRQIHTTLAPDIPSGQNNPSTHA